MTTIRASREQTGLADATVELRDRLGGLGLNVAVWDVEARPVHAPAPCSDFCRMTHRPDGPCRGAMESAARRTMTDDARVIEQSGCGCCVLATPVHRRRRVIGAVTVCYPPRDLRDEEALARFCDRQGLDRRAMTPLAAEACRHSARDADGLLDVLEWLLERQMGLRRAESELQTLSANLSVTYEELSLLYRISGSMRVNQDPPDFLHGVCEELLDVMRISGAVAVEHAHPAGSPRDTMVLAGRIDLGVQELRRLLDTVIAPRFSENNAPIVANRIDSPDAGDAVRNVIAAPLVTDKERIGMLVGINKLSGDFDSIDLKLLSSVGNQASVFLANNRLYADVQDLLMGVLHALTATIDAKDPYTCGHSQRVALISRRIAGEMGFPSEKVQHIYLSGLLHDVGKIGVPERILRKPGRLTEDEYAQIQRHPSIGARILGGIRQLDDVVPGLLTHHERPDGRGYPRGLKGESIPIEGRIIGLADCFDAMTSDRTYRQALPLEVVLKEIRDCAGSQFDPNVVDAFLGMDSAALVAEVREAADEVFSVRDPEGSAP